MNKQYVKITVLSVILVILIGVAVWAYGSLSDNYTPPAQTTAEAEKTTVGETKEAVITTDFTVTDKDGNTVSLSDFFGKPIVVNFWATWCSPCTSEMPHFEEAYAEYGDEVQFLMVNVGDSYEDAYKFVKGKGYTFPVYHDSTYSASYAYMVSSIPMTLFINESGELVTSQIGMMNKSTLVGNIKKTVS